MEVKKVFAGLIGSVWSAKFVLATVFVLTFVGANVLTLIDFHEGEISGQPDSSQFYYVSLDGFESNASNIIASHDFEADGVLDIVVNSNNGNCNWYGLVKDSAPSESDTHIALDDLNGFSVSSDEFLYWAAKPINSSVDECLLDFNVSVVTS